MTNEMQQREARELRNEKIRVSLLFLGALGSLVIFLGLMGVFDFGLSRHVTITYHFADGIERGSPVRLGGIKVGRVSKVHFGEGGESELEVELALSRESFSRLRDHSQFFINMAGLIGERYIEIVPGDGAVIENHHRFAGIDPPRVDQLFSQSFGIFGDLRGLLNENKQDIKEIVKSMTELSQSLNQLLGGRTPEQRKQISQFLTNMVQMSSDGRELVSKLNAALDYASANGAKESWKDLTTGLAKASRIERNDVRRLFLEDGVKVNFGSKQVRDEVLSKEKEKR